MTVPTPVGEYGVCTGDGQTRISPSDTSGSGTPSAVASTTKNLRLAYHTVGGSGVLDTCTVVSAQYD